MSDSNVFDFAGGVVHGGDVYRNEVRLDFSVNLNPLSIPAEVVHALADGLLQIHQYPDPYQQMLRAEIARCEKVRSENIICGNGASELLMAVVHAFRPRTALITAPCYAGYARALEASGAEITEYILDESLDFELDRGFACRITEDTDIVFITDPNNPNGKLIDPAVKRGIIRACEEKGALLIIDECFFPLTKAGAEAGPVSDNALHLRAFTKTFAIPGVRIGYMVSQDSDKLKAIRRHLPEWNISKIAEQAGIAAAKALADTDFLARSVSLIEEERAYLAGELERLGFRVYKSDTDYLLFRARPDLYEKLLRRGILIRRCSNFSGLDDTYFRIAVRKHRDNERLIRMISEEVAE